MAREFIHRLVVWSRARLDIGWGDLLTAAVASVAPGTVSPARVATRWDPAGAAFFTLRTAWDALLAELKLAPGEALVSAVNIPDMFELLEHHRLRPVAIDLDPATLAPEPGALRAALNERVRLVLVAHLLGSRVDMDALHAELDEAGARLPVIEDCAQAFEGPGYRGHPRSLAALFSFGPIKSSSALGGCLARIPAADLRRRVLARTSRYPRQRRRDYLKVVGQYAALKALTLPPAYATFVRACRLAGRSHDELINGAVLGLRGDDDWAALRRRPAAPLLRLLERRLAGFDPAYIERRREHGETLAAQVGDELEILGARAWRRSWWQFAVVSEDPQRLIGRLRAAGFDATAGASRLRCPARACAGDPAAPRARAAMAGVVYIPVYPELPAAELARLAELLTDSE